jgi:hypothetical protein
MVDSGGTRFELRVGTVVSEAALRTFQVPLRPTAVPRNTVYRLRIPADCDVSAVLSRLTEYDVQVLEIRRCPEPARRTPTPAPVPQVAPPADEAAGVVLPFPRRAGTRPAPAEPRSLRADDAERPVRLHAAEAHHPHTEGRAHD